VRDALADRLPPDGVDFGAGLTLNRRRGLRLAWLLARRGQAASLAERLGLPLEAGRAAAVANGLALPVAPGQWLLVGEGALPALPEAVAPLGYLSEQSAGRVVLRLAGPAAAPTLSRLCSLDLHASQAGPGFCAQTPILHSALLLHRYGAEPGFDLYAPASLAGSLTHALREAALSATLERSER